MNIQIKELIRRIEYFGLVYPSEAVKLSGIQWELIKSECLPKN